MLPATVHVGGTTGGVGVGDGVAAGVGIRVPDAEGAAGIAEGDRVGGNEDGLAAVEQALASMPTMIVVATRGSQERTSVIPLRLEDRGDG